MILINNDEKLFFSPDKVLLPKFYYIIFILIISTKKTHIKLHIYSCTYSESQMFHFIRKKSTKSDFVHNKLT